VGTTNEAESGGGEMNTPYCLKEQEFSDAAHAAAERMVYPVIFPNCDIEYESQSVCAGGKGRINDGERAIDYVLNVKSKVVYINQKLTFTVQERWRRPKTEKNFDVLNANDITITATNPTNARSEWEKMQCQWMLYGFYCESTDAILKAYWADVSLIRWKAVFGKEGYQFPYGPGPNGRSFQRFYSVPRNLPEVRKIPLDET
jgi:hypothetical protein